MQSAPMHMLHWYDTHQMHTHCTSECAGVCIKSLLEHLTREGHVGGGATCHVHVLAHGYQPTNGLAPLLQVMDLLQHVAKRIMHHA